MAPDFGYKLAKEKPETPLQKLERLNKYWQENSAKQQKEMNNAEADLRMLELTGSKEDQQKILELKQEIEGIKHRIEEDRPETERVQKELEAQGKSKERESEEELVAV